MKRLILLFCLMAAAAAWSQKGGIIYKEYDPKPYIIGFPGGSGSQGCIRIDVDRDWNTDFSVIVGMYRDGKRIAHFCAHGDQEPHYIAAGLPYWRGNDTRRVGRYRASEDGELPMEEPLTDFKRWGYYVELKSGIEYFGMKVIHGDSVYYGWCSMSYHAYGSDSNRVELNELAICTEPNYPLHIGQKSPLEIDVEPCADEINIYRAADGLLHIEGLWTPAIREVSICNVMGSQVYAKPCGGKDDLVTVDVRPFDNGIYMVRCLLDNGQAVTRKVLVRNR